MRYYIGVDWADAEHVVWVADEEGQLEQGGAGLASAKLLTGARFVRAFNGISYRRVGRP
jgi:hypothetical protein